MSVTTIYKCDKCGKEQFNNQQFWTVGVTANHSGYNSTEFVEGKKIQVCRDCLEGFGIYVTKKPESENKTEEYPSLEGLIREIIRTACATDYLFDTIRNG